MPARRTISLLILGVFVVIDGLAWLATYWAVTAPTEIFVPDYQYPKGYVVELSDGAYQIDRQALTLTVHHTLKQETHTVCIRPAS